MTWGIMLPTNFGSFFPDGSYVDAEAKATDHFENALSDEERNELAPVVARFGVTKLLANASRKFSSGGKRVEDYEKPTEVRTRKTYKKLGSFIQLYQGLMAVDQKLKDLIEEIEPGVHQFWPIQITMPKGVAYPKPFYGLVNQNTRMGFSREATNSCFWKELSPGIPVWKPVEPYNESIPNLAISKQEVVGAHLWQDGSLMYPKYSFSNELMDAIKAAGLSLPPERYKMAEI